MIEITYGREENHGKLRLKAGEKQRLEGADNSVPKSVSREHVMITICDDSSVVLKNLNIENDTFVNGTAVEQKKLKKGDVIELGSDHYRLEWKVIEPFIPVFIDISPLRAVWESYQKEKNSYQEWERKLNVLKSLTSLITMSAFVLGAVDIGNKGASLRIVAYGLAIIVSIFFAIKSWRDASRLPKKHQELDKRFKRQYICPNPNCRHFMGSQDYEILSQNKKCPYCGGLYIKENNSNNQ